MRAGPLCDTRRMPRSLVLGASGAIGRFLVPRLLEAGHDVVALSRERHESTHPRLSWVVGDLDREMPMPPSLDAIFSVGPLESFAQRLSRARIDGAVRIVAIGSQSADSKQDSPDPAERTLAERLRRAERLIADAADQCGAARTILRPTLIYGAGLDRSLTPIARLAERWHVFPYISGARGLRQPVHADDLAAACVSAFNSPQTHSRTYAVGGGERLTFSAMMRRVRASLPGVVIPLPVPLSIARAGATRARRLPAFAGASPGALQRLDADLIADHRAATDDFGWSPRAFHPTSADWMPPPLS